MKRPSNRWRDIATAPRDGTRIRGRGVHADRYTGKLHYRTRITWWAKTSHVPIYGWNHGRDVENHQLWDPEVWMPLREGATADAVDPSASDPGKTTTRDEV